jgi:hypothetical protein
MMLKHRSILIVCALGNAIDAAAAPAPNSASTSPPSATAPGSAMALPIGAATTSSTEAEFRVAPQGGAFEVPIHLGEVCILSFPERLAADVITNAPDFRSKTWEAKAWGDDGVAIRANDRTATRTTIGLSTSSGAVKVNITMVVVPQEKPSLTLVRFKAVTAEQALAAQVDAAVEARLAPLKAKLDEDQQRLEALIRDRADAAIVDRLFKRNESFDFKVHERNDDQVIVHLRRGVVVGEDGYIVFEIENRSSSIFRLAGVNVRFGAQEVSGTARLNSPAATRDPHLVGIVPPGATARGIVVVRAIEGLLGKQLSMTVAGAPGSKAIQLDDGIVFR